MEVPEPEASYDTTTSTSGQTGQYSRKLIYNINAELVADDCAAAAEALIALVEESGGYLANSYFSRNSDGELTYASLTLKVPAQQVDGLEQAMSTLGQVRHFDKTGEDITAQYYDVTARLDNAYAQQQVYRDMLADATTVEEALQVQAALDEVQERIEVFEGQLKLWDNLVSYSTLEVEITPTPVLIEDEEGVVLMTWGELGTGIKNGFLNAGKITLNVFGWLIIALACAIIPLAVLAAIITVLVLIIRALIKGGKKKRAAKVAQAAKNAEKVKKE